MLLLAVDPGLANTGLTLFENRHIIDARTLTTTSRGPRPEFTACVERGESLCAQLRMYRAELGEVAVLVAEAYADIPGKLRGAKNRWTTPLAIGLMVPALRDFTADGQIVWQDPAVVMTQYAQHVRMWELGQRGIIAGDAYLRNEHQRSAAAHGMFYLDHARQAVRA